MAKLLKYNGDVEDIEPKNGKDFQLEELYRLLDCRLIEVIYNINGDKNQLMIIDEEGAIKEGASERLNVMASFEACPNMIFGHAIICNRKQLK